MKVRNSKFLILDCEAAQNSASLEIHFSQRKSENARERSFGVDHWVDKRGFGDLFGLVMT